MLVNVRSGGWKKVKGRWAGLAFVKQAVIALYSYIPLD